MSTIIGIAEHYAQFVKLCRLRIDELGITYDTVDALCDFPERYTAKLLCQHKAMSIYSFFTIARALALTPAVLHDAPQLARLRTRKEWVLLRRRGARYRSKKSSGAVKFKNHVDFYKQIGRLGATRKSLLQSKRKQQTANARAARWSNGNGQ